jgi:ABC-2 type transport system permease protein
MNLQPILIRRELWEHRSLWIVPLVVAGLIILAALFAAVQIDPSDVSEAHKPGEVFAIFHSVLALPQLLLLAVVLPLYLLDCLYAERKDRSILFWKSLPVSDAQTVLSKFIVALAVVPLGVFVLTLATDVIASGILATRFRHDAFISSLLRWDTVLWLRTQGFMLLAFVLLAMWYAPVAAYLMLVSAWAKRNVLLWATLPPLFLMVAERIAFHTHYFTWLLAYRLNSNSLGIGRKLAGKAAADGSDALAELHSFTGLGNVDLWLGLAAAAVLLWLAIRVRRHQTES